MGVLIIVALALLAYGVYRIGDLFDVFADRYPIITLLTRADGLLEGAPVTLAGQRVGQVDEIEFLPVGDRRANLSLRLSISEDVREYIRKDSHARVRTQGLLGDRYVDIIPGSPDLPVVEPWDTIVGIDPIDIEDLLQTADRTLVAAQSTIENLRTITTRLIAGEGTLGRLLTDDELYVRVENTAAELEALLANASRQDGTLWRLIRDPTLYNQLVGADMRVDSLAGTILASEGTIGRLLHDDSVYLGLLGVIGRADTTIASLGGALGGLTDGDGSLQRLMTDPELYDQFLKAVIDLQTLINDIRLNPRRFRPEINVDIF